MSETRELLEGFLGGTKPITEVGTGRKYYLNPQTEEKYYLDEYNKNPYAMYKNNDIQVPLLQDNEGNRILRDDKDGMLSQRCNAYLKLINYPYNQNLHQIFGAAGDACANYIDMMNTQVAKDTYPVMVNGKQYDRSNDNYFHCKAHYQMADRGNIGYHMSPIIGYPREIIDYVKGIAQGKSLTTLNNDWSNDIGVNNYGRDAAKSGFYDSVQEACAPFRPSGLHSDF